MGAGFVDQGGNPLARESASRRRLPRPSRADLQFVITTVIALVVGYCNFSQNEETRRIQAESLVTQERSTASDIRLEALGFNPQPGPNGTTIVTVTVRVRNDGQGSTTLTDANVAEPQASFGTTLVFGVSKAWDTLSGKKSDPFESTVAAPSLQLRFAANGQRTWKIQPAWPVAGKSAPDFLLQLSIGAVIRSTRELQELVRRQQAVASFTARDVSGRDARVVLWDCGSHGSQDKATSTVCLGDLFAN